MANEPRPKFNWLLNAVASLGIGFAFTLILLLSGPKVGLVNTIFEALLWPGGAVAVSIYGGIHGEEPMLLLFWVNSMVYGGLPLLILWLRHRWRQHR